MNFDQYQAAARKTDQNPEGDLVIPLLGLVGEAGTLQTEYKKLLRDKDDHKLFIKHFKEELGDILWYVSNIATKLDLRLKSIAKDNLAKIHDRWPYKRSGTKMLLFDDDYPADERLPRKMRVKFKETRVNKQTKVKMSINEMQIGDALSDNAYQDDGYRYHDAFHLAFAAVLGWSPIVRGLLKRKRKSKPKVDEVEDGARAANIEEGLAAYVYNEAKNSNLFKQTTSLDFYLLKTIKSFVHGLEVSNCSFAQWERAILGGFKVFHSLMKNHGGVLLLDLRKHTIKYRKR